ncbi:MAG: tetratricopeptide repeat protein [Acidobacteriota bacterium]
MSQVKRLPYLKTKLQPPKRGRTMLVRTRLTEKLRMAVDLKATLVIADAGYGKTTLVGEFIVETGFPAVWYQLDAGDNDLLVFLRYLTYGLRQHYPKFGEISLDLLQAASSRTIKVEQLIDTWLNEVDSEIENKTIIALDDFHLLNGNETINNTVNRLLTYLPDTLHLIIISRTQPELNLARLRSKQSICWIDRTDLIFSESETAALFNEIYRLPSAQWVRECWRTADGWVTALQLICQVVEQRLRTHGAEEQTLAADFAFHKQSLFEIFDYFAEEVFQLEAPDIQEGLVKLSILDWIEPDICRDLLALTQPLEWLDDLVRRNVFITRRGEPGGETYHLHPLFRAFLDRRLTRYDPAEVASLHHRYAIYAAKHDRLEQALQHWRAAGEQSIVVQQLAEHGRELLGQGAFEAFKQNFDQLDAEAIATRPQLLVCRAEICWREGTYQQARELFEQAIKLSQLSGDRAVRAAALHGLAEIAFQQGEPVLAESRARAALEFTETQDLLLRAKCHNVLALCFWASGEFERAIDEWRVARIDAQQAGDSRFAAIIAHNLGLPYSLMGFWEEALECFGVLFADATTPFPQQAIAHLNIARIHLLRGEFSSAAERLEHALETCRLFNLRALRGEVIETLGNLSRDQGDFVRARDCYHNAQLAYQQVGLNPEDKELLDERATMFLLANQPDLAIATINQLYRARVGSDNELGLANVKLTRARIYLAQGEVAAALADIEPAQEIFEKYRMYYHLAGARAVRARSYFARGELATAQHELQQVLGLVERYGYRYWWEREARLAPTLFQMIGQECVTTEVAVTNTIEPESNYDLTVKLFGSIQIYSTARQRPEKYTWSLKQALSIFCFIAASNRRATKDAIIDLFWQEAPASVIAKNFHPTISYIRKALNSGLIHKRNFLIFANDTYQLNSEYRYFIDTERFKEALAAGTKARQGNELEVWADHLRTAIDLYRGDFLAELYDEWIDTERTYYLNQYLNTLSQLAGYQSECGEYTEAINLYQKILVRDNFREDVHCQLMLLYQKLGNQAAIKEQYDSLRQLLKTELKVEPLLETTRLYHTLIKK